MSMCRVIANDSLLKRKKTEDCLDHTLNVSIIQPINKSILTKFTDERDI